MWPPEELARTFFLLRVVEAIGGALAGSGRPFVIRVGRRRRQGFPRSLATTSEVPDSSTHRLDPKLLGFS